jgi:hypothetical protein
MSRIKPANVRYYVDADVRGLGKLLVQVRSDVTFPGDPGGILHKKERPACPVTDVQTEDDVWIAIAAERGWVIITRDTNIQSHRAFMEIIRRKKAKMVALSGADAGTTFAQLEVVMCNWRKIETLVDAVGPLIYTATRTSFKKVCS